MVNEGNEGILIIWAIPASLQDCLQEGFKSKSECAIWVKTRTKALSSGLLSSPYLLAHAKVTTGPPHSISHTSAVSRQHNQARVWIHFWDERQTSSRRSIFFLASPFIGPCSPIHGFHGPQPSSCTQPPPSSQRTSQVLFRCIHWQQSQLFHGYGGYHHHAHGLSNLQLCLPKWECYQTASPRAGPDSTKTTKPGPRHQVRLQMTCYLKKGKAGKKPVSKPTWDRHHPSAVHLHSIPHHHLWHKVMKGDLGQAEPVTPSFPHCSTKIENMYYWSHKMLTIMAPNPVISTDGGKLLTSLPLFFMKQKNPWVFSAA